jgi:hypothetical protein
MLQGLPRDAEQLAMESGCEYCECGVGGSNGGAGCACIPAPGETTATPLTD